MTIHRIRRVAVVGPGRMGNLIALAYNMTRALKLA